MRRLLILLAAVMSLALLYGCGEDSNPISTSNNISAVRAAIDAVPADAALDSVHLNLHVTATDTQTVQVHQIEQDWDEGDVTFTSFAGAFDASPLASIVVEDTGWYTVDVSATAQSWFDSTHENYGFLLQQSGADTAQTVFDSREADDNHPHLVVYYTTHDGASHETLMAIADAFVYSADSEINFGSELSLLVERQPGPDSVFQSLVRFDFPVEVRYATIGDRVWMDLNADGLQDDGEPGVEGVEIKLMDCAGAELAVTMTDADGMYDFDSLMAGDYQVAFVAPEYHLFSPMDAGDDMLDSDADPMTGVTACMSVLPGMDYLTVDAGIYPAPASVGDLVWNDENMNGVQDMDESGIEGIEVNLYTCDGDWVAMTTTNEFGAYLFDGLDAGEYYLSFINPFGYVFTYPNEGDDDAVDSDVDRYTKRTECFSVMPGDELTSMDAGLFAFDGCTYGKGYWKNHDGHGPQGDDVTMLLPIWLGDEAGDKSMLIETTDMSYDVLQQHTYGDPSNGITKLYAHLLTTKLNIMNFANPEDIYETVSDADAFLAEYDWMDWDMLSKDDQHMVSGWKDMLEQYNEGMIGPGSCDDDYDDDMDDNYEDDNDDEDDDAEGINSLFNF